MKSPLNSTANCYQFGSFRLDPVNRQLLHKNTLIELNARYLDALILMVSEPGQLISKQRFLQEVWQGASVSDEAITQCIKVLRKHLGDKATQSQFIETVPKHGYRFVAQVSFIESADSAADGLSMSAQPSAEEFTSWPKFFKLALSGVMGAGVAGVIGGLALGWVASSSATSSAVATLLVVLLLTVFVALLGGVGVVFGVATEQWIRRFSAWPVIGGALGGVITGATFKILGLDAFQLFMGESPGDITGALEGGLLGSSVGLTYWLTQKKTMPAQFWQTFMIALLIGGVAGVSIALLGGRLMTGSLDVFIDNFPKTQFDLTALGQVFGEAGMGPISALVSCSLEAMLFTSCIVLAMHYGKLK